MNKGGERESSIYIKINIKVFTFNDDKDIDEEKEVEKLNQNNLPRNIKVVSFRKVKGNIFNREVCYYSIETIFENSIKYKVERRFTDFKWLY